ncbi:MAG: ABC transporter permease, partial [Candidatus Hodarchaeota archaeon]
SFDNAADAWSYINDPESADIIIVSDQEIPNSLEFPRRLKEKFQSQGVETVRGYTISDTAFLFLEEDDTFEDAKFTPILPIDESSFWGDSSFSYDDWVFQFELNSRKHELIEETDEYDLKKDVVKRENEKAWRMIANDSHIDGKPIIITPVFGGLDIAETGGGLEPGDSVWLLDHSYQKVEFVVVAIHFGNALSEWFYAVSDIGIPLETSTVFVSKNQAERLLAFQEGLETQSLFLVGIPDNKMRSDANEQLARDIESWANGLEGEFRREFGIFGIAAIPVWDIYVQELDGMYRFFTFMQIFTSGGFIVGLVGLLVVSMRSVQERKREIGMMRSLGFRKLDVTFAVLLELIIMGVIGLGVGLFNGGILSWVLVDVTGGGVAEYLIPWEILSLYAVVILISAFIAAIIPGWLASRIPPSDALRYYG